ALTQKATEQRRDEELDEVRLVLGRLEGSISRGRRIEVRMLKAVHQRTGQDHDRDRHERTPPEDREPTTSARRHYRGHAEDPDRDAAIRRLLRALEQSDQRRERREGGPPPRARRPERAMKTEQEKGHPADENLRQVTVDPAGQVD